jgi:hypothetical protein
MKGFWFYGLRAVVARKPLDLCMRTTIRTCELCKPFFQLIKGSVKDLNSPAPRCVRLPESDEDDGVAVGLVILAGWPPMA